MVTCGNCGAQISIAGQRFCARCGAKVPETEAQSTSLHAMQEPKVPPFCCQCGAKTSIDGQDSASNAGQGYCQHNSKRHLSRNTFLCSNLCRRLRQGAM